MESAIALPNWATTFSPAGRKIEEKFVDATPSACAAVSIAGFPLFAWSN
jgi:hypothetical protein